MITIGFYEHADSGCLDYLTKAITIEKLKLSLKIGKKLSELIDSDIAIVHTNNNDNWQKLLEQSHENSIRIRISTAGFSDAKSPEKLQINGVYVLYLREPTTEVKEQWEEILTGITDRTKLDNLVHKPSENGWSRFFVKNITTIIPALSTLCQGYLAIHPNTSLNREFTTYLPQNVSKQIKKTEDPKWWQKPFANEKKDALTEKITAEWQTQKLPTEVSNLIDAIYGKTSITDVKIIEEGYKAIVTRLTSI
jgi:hypothetical protein